MVKQDAMNVFLGFYIPQEMTTPLWDLDSDYYLHNRMYRPPTPHINRILLEVRRLSGGSASCTDFTLLGEAGETKKERESSSRAMREEVARKYFINTRALQKEELGRISDTEAKGASAIYDGAKDKEMGKEKEMGKVMLDGAGSDHGSGEYLEALLLPAHDT